MERYIDDLRQFETLATVPQDQLEWLDANSRIIDYAIGDHINIVGTQFAGPHFILDGHVLLQLKQGNENREIAVLSKGNIFGYLPYSRGASANVSAQAVTPVRVLSFNTVEIRSMIHNHFELTQSLVHIMNTRVREFTSMQQQNDKMAALGKLAAGLAHEINNPAAALVSDSHSLRQHLRVEPSILKELSALCLEGYQVDGINNELFKVLRLKDKQALSLREKTSKEEAIARWLNDNGIAGAEEMSEIFVDFELGFENLNSLGQIVPSDALHSVLNWMHKILVAEKLMQDIQVASGRITEIVQSIKKYTHMDQGSEKKASDIHEGIDNTLTILGHKFRKGNIVLNKNYDVALPPISAFTGELNQVWTNLIDNALDSMEANNKGTVTITSERDRQFVRVTIKDDGPGIPENILPNIFDPFFTTKEVGKGTGMGLETVQRIMLKHKGSIKVHSMPGNTTFTVCFPISTDANK